MPRNKCKLSMDNKKFMIKMDKGGVDFQANVKLAYTAKILNLNDKKRCCLVTTGFSLDDFNTQHAFETKNNTGSETESNSTSVMKCQWFHSAIMIYTLLRRPDLASKNSGVSKLHSTGTADTFLCISREVLNSDPEGAECIKAIDSQVEMVTLSDEVTVKETSH